MKAHKSISYVVYPPKYMPGDGYQKSKQLKDAKRAARRYGYGSKINRVIESRHSDGTGGWQIYPWGSYESVSK
jgi:hypothetical protein